jgi:hypothetical protein
MALIPCRECGSQVSDAATYCPDCGIRNPADTREELLEVDRAAIARLPVDDWCEAEKARDIDAKLKLFTTDAVLMPSAESNVIGQQAIRAWHSPLAGSSWISFDDKRTVVGRLHVQSGI